MSARTDLGILAKNLEYWRIMRRRDTHAYWSACDKLDSLYAQAREIGKGLKMSDNLAERESTKKLIEALTGAGAPEEMIERAKMGRYHPLDSVGAFPQIRLLSDCHAYKLPRELIDRVVNDEFEPTQAELLNILRERKNSDTTGGT